MEPLNRHRDPAAKPAPPMVARVASSCLALALWLAAAEVAVAADASDPSRWPATVSQAVAMVVARLTPSQQSIVRGTSKDNLFMLEGEWGEDIKARLGLEQGNRALLLAACDKPCNAEQATKVLIEAAWEALRR